MNDLPGQANEVSLDLSHPFHAGFSFAAVGVAHDELPAVGLSAENLDRLVVRDHGLTDSVQIPD